MTWEIAKVMIETPTITAAIPTILRVRNPRNRMAPCDCYLVTDASSAHPIELQLKPFTFERSPKSSLGW